MQTDCTQQQLTSQPNTVLCRQEIHPEPTDITDTSPMATNTHPNQPDQTGTQCTIAIGQQKDGPPSKRTRSKCPLNSPTQSQPCRRNYSPGIFLMQQLPQATGSITLSAHIHTQTMPENAQQQDEPPSKRTRSQCPRCNTCPDNMPTHQISSTPPTQQLPLSAPAVHTTPSCSSQSNAPEQKRRRLLQHNKNLECPGPCTQPIK